MPSNLQIFYKSTNMILFIDTTIKDSIEIIIKDKNKILAERKIKTRFKETEKLLPLIDTTLKKNDLNLKDIKSIEVNNRGGSFTSLRIGVITANALGYALGIPVEGEVKSNKVKSKKFDIVSPIYAREPNITSRNA